MTSDLVVGLRALAESLPAGTAVPVPRETLLELLGGERPPNGPVATPPADFTVADLAERFGRHVSTVRAWIERGLFPGAYRFQSREWRVPASGLASFEASQRTPRDPHSQRPRRGRAVDLTAWRTAS